MFLSFDLGRALRLQKLYKQRRCVVFDWTMRARDTFECGGGAGCLFPLGFVLSESNAFLGLASFCVYSFQVASYYPEILRGPHWVNFVKS